MTGEQLALDGGGPVVERGVVVYESEWVTLMHGDSRSLLASMPDESVDLVITDPPYGVEFDSGFRSEGFGQIHNDTTADRDGVRQVMAHAVRMVGQHRHLYVFGPSDALAGLKVTETTELIWDKGTIGPGNLSAPWGPAHEPITFAVSKNRHAGEAGAASNAVRLRKGSVLRFTRPTGRQVRHPNEKPVGLLRELIESSSRAGERVLDPFAGSGSTGVAAVLLGRHALLVESDRRWIDLSIRRLIAAERVAGQMDLL